MSHYKNNKKITGRRKGVKNLKKVDGGFINQHGVFISIEERKKLENEVNKANKTRKQMLADLEKIPRKIYGVETGDTAADLAKMGKESDFILRQKTASVQRFTSREDFEKYLANVTRVNNPKYLDDRTRLYKRNMGIALDNVFGDEAKDVKMKIRMMKPADYRRIVEADETLEISYVYDPTERAAKLNQIRAALGMKLKEEFDEDY